MGQSRASGTARDLGSAETCVRDGLRASGGVSSCSVYGLRPAVEVLRGQSTCQSSIGDSHQISPRTRAAGWESPTAKQLSATVAMDKSELGRVDWTLPATATTRSSSHSHAHGRRNGVHLDPPSCAHSESGWCNFGGCWCRRTGPGSLLAGGIGLWYRSPRRGSSELQQPHPAEGRYGYLNPRLEGSSGL